MVDDIPNFFDPKNELKNIGTKLSDFETIKNDEKDYTILGTGNFSYCEKMKSKINNHFYAIKKLAKIKPKDLKRETQIMSKIDNKYCARFYGYFKDIEKKEKYKEIYKGKKKGENVNQDLEIYCLVIEYICNGTLENYYLKNIGNIPEDFIIKIFKQLLNALIYLHNKIIMHRDIKPDNILLDENNDIKIVDFGLCTLSEKDYQKHIYDNNIYGKRPFSDKDLFGGETKCGHKKYIPEEIKEMIETEKKKPYGVEVDIYELGKTIIVLMSTEDPKSFNKILEQENFRDIFENYIKNGYNSDLIHLVKKMIKKEGSLRPTAEEALYELILIENNIIYPRFEGFKNSITTINKNYEEKVKNFEYEKTQFYNMNMVRNINNNLINNNINNNSNINGNNNQNNNKSFGNNNINMSQMNENNNPNNNIFNNAFNNIYNNQLNGNIIPNNNIFNNAFNNNNNYPVNGNIIPNNNNIYGNNIINMNPIYGYNIPNNNNFINNNINMYPINNMNNIDMTNSMNVNMNLNMNLSHPNINYQRRNSLDDLQKVQLYALFQQFYDNQIINVIFIFNQEIKTTIQAKPDTTVEELLKNYVQIACLKNNYSDYLFIFNHKKLDPIPGMKIKEMMIKNDNSIINVYDVNSLLGA